jgi:hypothetical protein
MGQFQAIAAKWPLFSGVFQPLDSAELVRDVINGLTLDKDSGKMVSHDGNQEWL